MKEKAKYVQLFERLKGDILRGVYANGQKLAGENEMAEEWGMSRQTVRQALALLEQEGLIERRQGSGTFVRRAEPRRKRSWQVGVIATFTSEYIFPAILRGMKENLEEEGFFPLLGATQNRVDEERRILEECLEKQVDGLLVEGTKSALPNPNLPLYQKLQEKGIPLVFFNGVYPGLEGCVSVTMDDPNGGREAVRYLAARGHRNVGAILKSDDVQGLHRYEGYAQGLLECGLPLEDSHVAWYNSQERERLLREEGALDRILDRLEPCTALVCYNDELAVRVEKALQARGVDIPREKAIISFDNSLLGELAPVPLTSFDHPKENMGAAAARKLLDLLSGREEKDTVYPWALVERSSV